MDWTSKDAILEEKDNGKLLVMDKFKVMRNLDRKLNSPRGHKIKMDKTTNF